MRLEKNNKIYRAAVMARDLDRKWLTAVLGIFSILGVIALFAAFIPAIGPFQTLAKLLVLVMTITLPAYIFIKNYFFEIDEKADLATDNLYEASELDIVPLMEKIRRKEEPNKIFAQLIEKPRVNFIIARMFCPESVLTQISESYDNKPEKMPQILESAVKNAEEEGRKCLTSADLFYGFVKNCDMSQDLLRTLALNDTDLKNVVAWGNHLFDRLTKPKRLIEKLHASEAGVAENWSSGYSLYLNRFGTDITTPSRFGEASPEGRDNIIMAIENALTKAGSNSCILTGDVGVGKNSLVYAFARKVYWGETREELAHKRIFYLDLSSLMSGLHDEGEAVQRLIGVLNDAVFAGNIILFIDRIDNLFSGQREGLGTIDATEVILPYLSSNLKIIGISSEKDYATYIAPKAALAGAFDKIEVPETNEEETMRLLEDMSLIFGAKYGVMISYAALKEIYAIADRYVTNKSFPEKGIDVLNNIASTAKSRKIKLLDRGAVQNLASELFKAPIGEVQSEEKEVLLSLEEKLHQRVIGQDEAINSVSNALRRARVKVGSDKKPIGSFLFLGPTGVGKTELSKTLAWAYFGDENAMIRMDMNEFQSKDGVDRFLGRKITGRDELEGGEFVKKVREKPFSVVLLDEIEKAHPDILNLFLQMLDEGYLKDGMGQKVVLTNAIIIATSNAGANMIREGVQSKKDMGQLKIELVNYLQNQNIYRPEFLNRFDDVILFSPLSETELGNIAKLMFASIVGKMEKEGYKISIDEESLKYLTKLGYKPEFGAREMRRVFQDKIESLLAKKVLAGEIEKGSEYKIAASDIQ